MSRTEPQSGTRRSAASRGLGYDHRRARERLIRSHVDGSPCPCGVGADCGPGCICKRAGYALPMYRDPQLNPDGMPLEADHTLARSLGGTRADRLMLATCNRSRGNGTYASRTATASADGSWPLNPATGTHCPPWWTRDWTGEQEP